MYQGSRRHLFKRMTAAFLTATMMLSMAPFASAVSVISDDSSPQITTNGKSLSLTNSARRMDFNDNWSFSLNPQGSDNTLAGKEFDDSKWRNLNLPHDWSIEQDFTNKVSSEIGHLPGGTGWYRKSFVLPEELKGKRINIDFDGVYMDSHIWVNGKKVGNYPNGYLPFSFDVTDYVVCDGKTENVIAVKVTNITQSGNVANQSSRWYSGSGIYRDVHMTVTDPVHVTQYGTVISTPNIEKEAESGNITVNAKTTVENKTNAQAQVKVRSTILNYKDGSEFLSPVESEVKVIEANSKVDVEQTMLAQGAKLWSVDSPNLYKMKTEIIVNDVVKDTYETRFGFTWSKFLTTTEAEKAGHAFELNGEPMKLHGVCMHHDQGALGAVGNADAIERQMHIMKDMGVNSIRVTHNPASPELMRICDEMGITVVEEAFDTWYGGKKNYDYHRFFEQACTYPAAEKGITWAQFDLQQMIRSDRNSPSIIAWSLGNEIGETNSKKGLQTVENLVKWGKEIDRKHPLTMGEDKFRMGKYGSDSWIVKVADQLDVVGMNYAEGNYDYYKNLRPNWKIYGSETSSAIKSRGYYSDPQKKTEAQNVVDNQLSSYDNKAVPWGKTATNSWIPDRDRKWIAGQYIWTGFDYIGEPTPWNQRYDAKPKSSYFGIVDTAGFPKDDYYLYQSQWLDVEKKPMVHIFPHWNWENQQLRNKVISDGNIPIRVYSNAPKVELTVTKPDGRKIEIADAEKSFYKLPNGYQQQSQQSNRLYLEWNLKWEYVVGTKITATAKDSEGRTIATDTVVTAGSPSKVKLSTDKQVIDADGNSLSYIVVDIQDENGNFMPTAMNQVNFRISGDGVIVGVDNGNPASWERFKDTNGQWKRSAFNGKAVVIVQSTEKAGSFTLTAQSAGLDSDAITVYTTDNKSSADTILGYEVTKIMTDVGVVPSQEQMPKKVNAVYANGNKKEMDVVWDMPTEEQLSKPSEVTVNGRVTETNAEVTMTITVRGKVGVQPISLITKKGVKPTLPKTVTVVWSDGKTETKNVTWSQIDDEQVANAGSFKLESTSVEGTEFTAVANIRVVENTEERNIALSSNGTKVQVSYEEGSHLPIHLIDGNKTNENGWGNWESSKRKQDTATLIFDKEYDISKVNVWINTLSGKTWQKPDEIKVEYWNGSDWAAVQNQSKTTGFTSLVNAQDSYTGNEITFDAVKTNKIRFTFKINQYTGSNNMMKIMETEVFADVLPIESGASLSDLKVNGQTVQGFNANTYGYLVETDFKAETPVVTATAQGNATVFVRQAISNNGTAVATVTSEDGKTKKDYTIQFVRKDPTLETVTLEASTNIKADDVITLSAKGILQDKSQVDSDKVLITYKVNDNTGHAEIQNGKLYAYDAGTVNVIATMTYHGTEVSSAPITITIAKNTVDKWVKSFEAVTVRTAPKTAPKLPEKVTVNFNTGLARKVNVKWDNISEDKYQEMNTFTVNGTVDLSGIVTENKDINPVANVMVVSAVAAQNISMAVPKDYAPELPQNTLVYFSDGSTGELPVKWDNPNTKATDDITIYNGTVTYSGEEIPVTASVRVGETTQSSNYVIVRNGYDLPVGLASYTNDRDANSKDSAKNLNDGNSNFKLDGKKIWCNWIRGTQNTTDWVSVTIANEGVPTTKTVNSIKVGFMNENGGANSIALPADYFVEYYTGSLDYKLNINNIGHVTEWADSPLNNPENWKEVKYIDEKPAVKDRQMTEVKFEPVATHLVRVRMNAKKGYCLGVNELEVYGEIATQHDNFEVTSIKLDDENIISKFNEENNYKVKLESSEKMPQITAEASNNASITIVPSTIQNSTATVRIVPESGAQTAIKEYKIVFEGKDIPQPEKFITVKFDTNGGSNIQDKKVKVGNQLVSPQDPTYAGRIFRGWYSDRELKTPFDFKTKLENDITLYAKWENKSSGGSSSSGSSTTKPKPETDKTETIINSDGSKTTTVTKPDGSKTQTTNLKDGSLVLVETAQNGAPKTEVTLSSEAVKGKDIVKLPVNNVKKGNSVKINLPSGEKSVTIEVPVINPTVSTVADIIDANGKEQIVKKSVTTKNGIRLNIESGEVVKIIDNSMMFTDVPKEHWSSNAVAFVTSHQLFNGISKTEFSPNGEMNRAMIVTVLARLSDVNTSNGSVWYEAGVNWAKENNISDGTNLDSYVTREQLATMLYRYAGSPKVEKSENNFSDADKISSWAVEAMNWAIQKGLISGMGDGTVNPQGQATRAQVATIMQRFIANN